MKKGVLAGVLIAALFAGCQEQKTKKQIEKLLSEAIVVPPGIKQVLLGRDTVLVKDGSAAARLVIYTDSLSCSTCRLSFMFEYNDILTLHEESGGKFEPIFIFSPKAGQSDQIRNTLLLNRFDYPILLDEKGLFPAANPHIPTDKEFHTFLLDHNGNIVLTGNPISNPALWELYKEQIRTMIDNRKDRREKQENRPLI